MSVLAQLVAALGATEPTPPPAEPSRFDGWPLLGIAAVIGLCAFAYVYRHQPGDDEP